MNGPAKDIPAKKEAPKERDAIQEMDALLQKARAAEQGPGGAAAALALLDAAPPDVKALGMLHYARGTLHYRTGDLEGALAAFREAVRIEPEVPEFAGNLGAVLIEKSQRGERAALDEALAVLERAAALGPKLPLVHANLGLALQKAGRAEEALLAVERALEIDAKSLSALLGKASLQVQLGLGEAGLATIEEVLKIQPGFPLAVAARDAVRRRLGK